MRAGASDKSQGSAREKTQCDRRVDSLLTKRPTGGGAARGSIYSQGSPTTASKDDAFELLRDVTDVYCLGMVRSALAPEPTRVDVITVKHEIDAL